MVEKYSPEPSEIKVAMKCPAAENMWTHQHRPFGSGPRNVLRTVGGIGAGPSAFQAGSFLATVHPV